jgi:hypothetical protein
MAMSPQKGAHAKQVESQCRLSDQSSPVLSMEKRRAVFGSGPVFTSFKRAYDVSEGRLFAGAESVGAPTGLKSGRALLFAALPSPETRDLVMELAPDPL